LRIENPYIKQRRIANPPQRREHPPQRDYRTAVAMGSSTIKSKHIIESGLQIKNLQIKQRRITDPPQRVKTVYSS
jgi:hypothetical protein